MYCHIIPQVYQKAWRNRLGKANVFYFEKGKLSQPVNAAGGNVNNNMGIEDEYIIDVSEMQYNIDPNQKAVEEFFAYGMENSWNDILKSNLEEWIKQCSNDKKLRGGGLLAIKAQTLKGTPLERKLLEHIILQYLRVFDNFLEIDKMTNGGLVNDIIISIHLLIKERYPNAALSESDLIVLLNDEKYKKSIWKSLLLDCHKRVGDSYLGKVFDLLTKQGNLTFFWAGNINTRYILSDRPVVWNAGKKKKHDTLESGVFFPISPNLLVASLGYGDKSPLSKGDVVCLPACENFVKYINHILHTQSHEQLGFYEENILAHISTTPFTEKEWDDMFRWNSP